jgi:hypothetical protein
MIIIDGQVINNPNQLSVFGLWLEIMSVWKITFDGSSSLPGSNKDLSVKERTRNRNANRAVTNQPTGEFDGAENL